MWGWIRDPCPIDRERRGNDCAEGGKGGGGERLWLEREMWSGYCESHDHGLYNNDVEEAGGVIDDRWTLIVDS